MKAPDVQRIEHMLDYCREIAETIERFGSDYDAFLSDKDYFKSISMSIMQIGELSAGLSDGFKKSTSAQIQWPLVKAMRNMFAHTYTSMDKGIIWETAWRDIPNLLEFCKNILAQNDANCNEDSEQD